MNHRAYVGPEEKFDLVAANQFNVLTSEGLRQHHLLLDVGCGSLRGGRLFIPYLNAGNYFGIEPNRAVLEEGIKSETGAELVRMKRATFSNDDSFNVATFNRTFDFVLAQSIFSHTTQKQIDACLRQVKSRLQPDGKFLGTHCEKESFLKFHGTTSDEKEVYEGDEWTGCAFYSKEFMRAAAEKHQLKFDHLPYKHPHGQTWFIMTHL